MNKLKLIFVFIILLTHTFVNVLTVDAGKPPSTVKLDTSKLNYKPVPEERLAHYKQSAEFKYIETQPVYAGFWKMLLYKIKRIFNVVFSYSFSTLLIYAIFIILFVVLILSLLGADIQSILSRNKKVNNPIVMNLEENIHDLDLDQMVQHEIDAGNYNLAIRYLYLKLLKTLTWQHLITWQRDKTNHDYLNELSRTRYINEFKAITLTYEYVWYGKFPCNRSNFESIHNQFNDLYKQLNA